MMLELKVNRAMNNASFIFFNEIIQLSWKIIFLTIKYMTINNDIPIGKPIFNMVSRYIEG